MCDLGVSAPGCSRTSYRTKELFSEHVQPALAGAAAAAAPSLVLGQWGVGQTPSLHALCVQPSCVGSCWGLLQASFEPARRSVLASNGQAYSTRL